MLTTTTAADMITLQGLTLRQRQLCDLMWSCSDLHEVQGLIRALPTLEDQQQAETLMQVMIQESLEQQGAMNDYSQDCADVIDRVRSSR